MSAKLYVGGISFSTTQEGLVAHFAQCGQVAGAEIVTDRMSGRSRGFGFVTMASPEDARKAVEALNGKPLDGRNLTVEVSQPKPGGSARPAGAGGQGGARGGQGGSGGPGGHRGPPRPDRW